MKATIEKINGKWTVNGKPHSEMSMFEIGLLNEFFQDLVGSDDFFDNSF